MKMKSGMLLAIGLIISALFSLSSCTVCYVCTDSECEDSYSGQDEHAIDCARIDGHTEDGGCSKWKSKARYSGMDYYYVQRTCGRKYDNTECDHLDREVSKDSGSRALIWKCSCKGSRCNTALPLSSGLSMTLLFLSTLAGKFSVL